MSDSKKRASRAAPPPSSTNPAAGEGGDALSRRSFLKGVGGIAGAGMAIQTAVAEAAEAELRAEGEHLSGRVEVELEINGAKQKVAIEPRTTLLNALRNHCSPPLTGAKLVCDRGNCGACTVLLDGRPVYACLTLAADCRGRSVRTVEGLAKEGQLSPLQQSFCDKDALMCGFCTPGFIMAITACLERKPDASVEEIKESCSGNICRCGTQPHIFEAALAVSRERTGGSR